MKAALLILLAFVVAACSADDRNPNLPGITPSDLVVETPKVKPKYIPLDIRGELRDDPGNVRVYQVSDKEQLIRGPIAHGKVGDWILENDRVRFLIEGDDRVMNPCPYGGTVLDISYLEGESDQDILGEVCLFINAAQTLDPEYFEVVPTGTNAAVLAVTGHLELGDYINIKGTVDDFLPGLSTRLPLDPDKILPVTVTVYYILQPGDLGLRVFTVLRNDSDAQVDAVIAHLVMSGGNGGYFNPLASTGGFGAGSGGFAEDSVPYVAFRGDHESYMFMPDPNPELPEAVLPYGGKSLTISGVAAVASDVPSIVGVLTNANFSKVAGVLHIPPGESRAVGHRQFGGDGAVSTMLDEAYPLLGTENGRISGKVLENGQPATGVRVSAVRREGADRTMSQAITDSNGEYTMIVPTGTYMLRLRRNAQTARIEDFEVEKDVTVLAPDASLEGSAQLLVSIHTPDGQPVSGRVTVICDGECNNAPTSLETDISTNKLPSNWQAVQWAGVDGQVNLQVPAGDYRVFVTRGFEWTTWPYDAIAEGGFRVSLAADDTVTLDAEIAHVVDTAGALSGDFHVHALPSPDSPVPQADRVLNFLGEGVDVLVSTDHDIVADYAPVVDALGANAEIATLVGMEITTGNTGHFNAFPLQRDPTERRGGNLDWSRGPLNDMEPADVFAWAHEQTGTQVVQLNHPSGMGLVHNTMADPLRGMTFKPRSALRLDPMEPDPVSGDTRIWSDDFTALEVMTGSNTARFFSVGRWWLQMVGRGFTPTATAVTDTHKLYGDLGGSPRTYVFVGEAFDSPATFDAEVFTTTINRGAVIGSRGPYFEVRVTNAAGETIGLGQTLSIDTAGATATLTVDVPEWMPVNAVDVYINLTDEILTEPGEANETPWPPTTTVPITLEPQDLVEVAVGTAVHRHYRKTLEIPINSDVDAWVIFVVRGAQTMSPLAPGQTPFAYSNPIYLDPDGSGYNNPPLKDLANTLPPHANMLVSRHASSHIVDGSLPDLTPELLLEALAHGQCVH